MITALDVANTFISKSKEENVDITPMKLQKLIYIMYKNYLQRTNRKLFSDKFEVWKYGPVVPSVYQAFKEYRSNAITDYYYSSPDTYSTVKMNKNKNFDDVFKGVWNKYSELDGVYLSQLTHRKETAWSLADKRKDLYLADNDIIRESEYEIAV